MWPCGFVRRILNETATKLFEEAFVLKGARNAVDVLAASAKQRRLRAQQYTLGHLPIGQRRHWPERSR